MLGQIEDILAFLRLLILFLPVLFLGFLVLLVVYIENERKDIPPGPQAVQSVLQTSWLVLACC